MASTIAISRPKVGPRTQPASRACRAERGRFLSLNVVAMIGRRTSSYRFTWSDSSRGDGLADT